VKRALLLALLGAAACQPRTEMIIGIATDIRAPDIIDAVQLNVTRVRDGYPEEQLPPWTISGLRNIPYNLPGSFGVYQPDGNETKLIVDLVGLKDDVPLVTRHAVLSLVNGKTLFVRMGLVTGCMNRTDCSQTESCVEGRCVAQEIDPHILPVFRDELVTALSCNSGTSFINTEDGSPMPLLPEAATCPASLCGEGTCFHPPDGAAMADAGMANSADGGTGGMTTSCPGDTVGGPGLKLADATAPTALAVDDMNVYFTDQNAVLRMGPCGGAGPVYMNEAGAHGLAVAGGNLFWITNNTIRMAPTGGGGQPVTVASISTANNGFLTSDGTVVYFTDNMNVFSVNATAGASVMPEQMGAAPGGTGANFISVGAGQLAWVDGQNVALKKAGDSTFTSFPILNVGGLVVDMTGNLYYTDSATGLNVVPPIGTVMNLASAGMFNDVPGRVASDGQHLFVHSASGTNDILLQMTPDGASTVLANGATFAPASVQPALAAAQHGVYWINDQNQIFRSPIVAF
jgi:hypothetical protein